MHLYDYIFKGTLKVAILLLVASSLYLTACGQKGPLYSPSPTKPHQNNNQDNN
ncbi:MAG: lipoprotein [Candidatus Thiodiazotropha sp. (ex Lucinoma kastoroae)]|nr:lipoprotein [Candidatus Thiodiazotropha sp. (ex Rostrolucina anterorostrata)]MCU7846917.1 lipoprotein [Candidatus Thiodiazotropha sp. (ex Lucinoma kastoroae)]MCU7860333.1 lipoprotein [Candidatus Thiodiazotropha sp. (ex Lucinoma kastoroae)]